MAKHTGRTKTVYGYVRVSTEAQVDSGLGLDAQRQQIREASRRLAMRHGLAIGQTFADPGVSATRKPLLEREGGRRLDAELREGDHVVIAKLDRAFRSQRDCVLTVERWIKRGVVVHMLDLGVDSNTPLGRMLIGILSTIAQWESARIGERIADAAAASIAGGRSSSGWPAIGWVISRNRKLAPDHATRRLARMIERRHKAGESRRSIADWLNDHRAKRPQLRRMSRIGQWTHQAVGRFIRAAKAGFPPAPQARKGRSLGSLS